MNNLAPIDEGKDLITRDYLNATNIVNALGTTPVNRAAADADGNNIASTYLAKTSLSTLWANSPSKYPSEALIGNYIASRGLNLVSNGTMLLGTNYNFSFGTYDGSNTYYAGGSIKKTGRNLAVVGDEFIPVNVQDEYLLSYYIKCANSSAKFYDTINSYDIDKKQIMAYNVMWIAGSTTKLARELKKGDTVVYLESVAGFNKATTQTYQKGLIFWNYKNSFGYQYPIETYSRYRYSNIWADSNSINTSANTITLSSAWAGENFPAGTDVSQCTDGGNYIYLNSNYSLPENEWVRKIGRIKGVGKNNASGKFREGTAFIRIGWLMNRDITDNTDTWLSTIEFTTDRLSYSSIASWAKASTKPSYSLSEITNIFYSGNEFNIAPSTFNFTQLWFNYRSISGTNLSNAITDYYFGNGQKSSAGVTLNAGSFKGATGIFSGSVTAASFIKSGGSSSQFLKADGSVDSTKYASSQTAGGPADYVRWEQASTNIDRRIPFAWGDNVETTNARVRLVYSNNFLYNPSTGAITAGAFKKSGGTSAQVLLANGDVVSKTINIAGSNVSLGGTLSAATLASAFQGTAAVYEAKLATEAITLKNTRKIWGNDFDGSADVTGHLTLNGKCLKVVEALTGTSNGGYASGMYGYGSRNTVDLIAGVGFMWSKTASNTAIEATIQNVFMGVGTTPWSNHSLRLTATAANLDLPLTSISTMQATQFKVTGGTASQFMKANGTLDSTAYLPLTGGNITGSVSINANLTIQGANTLRIGEATLAWDGVHQCLRVDKSFYSDIQVAAGVAGDSPIEGGSGDGSIRHIPCTQEQYDAWVEANQIDPFAYYFIEEEE